MNEEHNLAIFEAGISKPGEMNSLEKIIHPTIGIFTNLGEAHGENFQNNFQKAIEKSKLFINTDIIIYPSDDQTIKEALTTCLPQHKFFTWGKHERCKCANYFCSRNNISIRK